MTAVGRLAVVVAGFAALATLALWMEPAPAAAFSPSGALCGLTGLVSGLLGKACTVATHAGQVISAGKQLLSGRLGGAVSALSGGGAAGAVGRGLALGAIAVGVTEGAHLLLHHVATLITATTSPELGASWFAGPYWRMAAVAALLTLPFLFAAAIQALVRSDLALLVRAAFGWLPLGMLAVGVAAPVTMLLLAASNELSAVVSSASGHAGTALLARSGLIGFGSGASGGLFVWFFVGLVAAAGALWLWVELLIRQAAVYVIVLMLPLFFAAMVWPARRVWAVRAVELLVALILSKFAIVAVLSLGGAALSHAHFTGVATLMTGTTLVLLACFCPWALMRLLPLHELAGSAAGGLSHAARGAPGLADARAHAATDLGEESAAALTARLAERSPSADASTADEVDETRPAVTRSSPDATDVHDVKGEAERVAAPAPVSGEAEATPGVDEASAGAEGALDARQRHVGTVAAGDQPTSPAITHGQQPTRETPPGEPPTAQRLTHDPSPATEAGATFERSAFVMYPKPADGAADGDASPSSHEAEEALAETGLHVPHGLGEWPTDGRAGGDAQDIRDYRESVDDGPEDAA